MIRVFARKTKMTPTDDLAFYDGPPLYELPDLPVYVSVTFTWDLQKGINLFREWQHSFPGKTWIGGPGILNADRPNEFVPGRFLKQGITITSRGCPKNCPWCLVPKKEGKLKELKIQPGYRVQDNNLLACSQGHILAVFDMLMKQKRGIIFSGGLDIDYLCSWHIEFLKKIKIAQSGLWVACDREADLPKLDKVKDLLSDFPIDKKRCYVLMGFDGDTPAAAIRRCEKIYDKERGFLPFAQYYQPPTAQIRIVPKKWRFAVRKWARPAAYRPKK